VLAFTYLLIPWSAVPSSLVARNLEHKKTSKVTFFTDVLAACLSLTLAYLGYGYWALVAAVVFTAVFNCLWFNRLIDYPKMPRFSTKGMEVLFTFGALVALSEIIFVAYSQVDIVIMGRFFDIAEIGMYGVAVQLATMLLAKTVPLFNVVAFPAFARINAIEGDSNDYLVTALRFASILVFPIFLGVAMVADDLIGVVLGNNWVEIAGIFSIVVVTVPLRIISYITSPAVLAAGGARINMENSFLTLLVLIVAIFALMPFGLPGVAVAWSIGSLTIFSLTMVRGGRLLSIALSQFASAFSPALFCALAMCCALYVIDLGYPWIEGAWGLYKIPAGAVIYFAMFWFLFRRRSQEVLYVVGRLAGRPATS
jgi:O-antigen/teichoic acid export membrane protein